MPDECIDMEEKDPDIIPTNKGNFTFIFISIVWNFVQRKNWDHILAN